MISMMGTTAGSMGSSERHSYTDRLFIKACPLCGTGLDKKSLVMTAALPPAYQNGLP